MDWAAFLVVLGGCVVATLLHEATHYAVAWALGREVRFSVREWAVYFADGPARGTLLIQAAPVLVGLWAGLVSVLAWGIEPLFVVPWIVYTLWGALTNDFGFHVLDPIR